MHKPPTRIKRFTKHTYISRSVLLIIISLYTSLSATAQVNSTSKNPYLTLEQCIDYAMHNQPVLKQSLINVSVAQKTNQIALSGWLPQVDLTGNATHYFEAPTSLVVNNANPEGPLLKEKSIIVNTVTPGITASEVLFNPSLLYAAKSAHLYIQQAEQVTDSTKINLITSVSKSFYTLLNTLEQIDVYKEDTARLGKNLRDSYHQYVGGIVDKTDYEEATISLNNSRAQLKQAIENVTPQYAVLKQLIGYPPDNQFSVSFDTAQMMKQIVLDTVQALKYENRIEYQQLQTARSLQSQLTNYYRYNFLPTISGFYEYNYEYESNTASNLFSNAYPYSLIGLSFNMPLFTGFGRLESVQKAKLQGQLIDLSEVNLKSAIYTQYSTALANYKSNVYSLSLLRDNVTMAKDAYGVISLQYKQGVVAYLNVITAESNLISAEISYLNALFQLLSSEIDLKKSMGDIKP